MQKILLEPVFRQEEKKKIMIHLAFTKGKLGLTKLMTFYEEVNGSVD